MGNAEFHPESDRQFCGFNTKVFTASFPELATIIYSSILGVLLYLLLIGFVLRAKIKAMRHADSAAAAAVVLPSYLPILYMGLGSALTQILVVLGYASLCDSSYLDQNPWLSGINPLNSLLYAVFVFGYEWFANTIAVLFFLKSVSRRSFARALGAGLAIAFLSASLSGLAIDYVRFGGRMGRGFEYLLMIAAQAIPILLLLVLSCRPGTRSAAAPFLIHGLTWRLLQVSTSAYFLADAPFEQARGPAEWLILFIQALRTAIFPIVVYRTLLLDTWYWRGVPRRKTLNADAIRRYAQSTNVASSTSLSSANELNALNGNMQHPEAVGGLGRWLAQPRYPPRDPANDRLQQLLDDAAELVIDHAFLSVDYDTLLGRGASASVFRGTLTVLWGGQGARFFPNLFRVSGSALLQQETHARTVEVAVKMYTPPELDEEAILAIKEETRAWGELSQMALSRGMAASGNEATEEEGAILISSRPPNVVRFFGMCVMPPHLSLVFEYCDGGALSEWLGRSSPPPQLATRYKIALDCSLAVLFLHLNGFIHRDLKSENFLLKNGTALLTDFGTCIPAESTSQQTFYCGAQGQAAIELSNAVLQGTTVGTIDHMAPELLSDRPRESDPRLYSNASDVYALAVVAASIVTFRKPFPGLREWSIREKVLNGERPFDLDEFVFQHDPPLRNWIKKAFSPNPIERPTALELVEILELRQSSQTRQTIVN